MELTVEQVRTLVMVAVIITQAIKIVYVGLFKQPKPSEGNMRIIAFGASVVAGYFYSGVTLPPLSDPMALATALLEGATTIFVFAHLAYEVFVSNFLGWLKDSSVSLVSAIGGFLKP